MCFSVFDFAGVRVTMKLIWKPFKEQFQGTRRGIAMYVDVIEKEVGIIEKEVGIIEKEAAYKERIKA